MSLLNITNDGLPNVLVLLYSTLASSKGSSLSDSRLFSLLAPPGLPPNAESMVRKTLNRWIELGLFAYNKERYSINDDYRIPPKTPETHISLELRKVVRRAVFARHNNERFWDATENRAADFT